MKNTKLLFAALLCSVVAVDAYAAGFEKSVMWSGKEAGYAGAGQSHIGGAQSLVFNPAGLANGESEASVNFSPTFLKFEGALVNTAVRDTSDHNFSPIGGVAASYRLNERFGFGVGAYVAGGSKAIYDGVNLSAGTGLGLITMNPRIATDFRVMEYSVGGGYEVAPGFRLGAAWRISQASGGLSTAKKAGATAVSYINIVDAKQTKYNGFRLGAQYDAPNSNWGVGASFRNAINFVAKGGINGNVQAINGAFPGAVFSNEATLGTTFPWAASLGGHYTMGNFLLLADVDHVHYSSNTQLVIVGTLNGNALPNIPLNWNNLWNFRIGTEYSGLSMMKLRFGYSLTTKVTNATDARATIAPAGLGHLLTVGAGTSIWKNFDIDGAFEYAFNKGTGSMSATPTGATSSEFLAGVDSETKATSIGLHTGVTYRF